MRARQRAVRGQSYQSRLLSILGDGQWHDFEDLFKAVSRFIDANLADREYRKRHPAWKMDDEKVRIFQGKKRLVQLVLISYKYRSIVDGRGPSGDQEFRMTKEEVNRRKKREKVLATA
jgi:hypothetical protein